MTILSMIYGDLRALIEYTKVVIFAQRIVRTFLIKRTIICEIPASSIKLVKSVNYFTIYEKEARKRKDGGFLCAPSFLVSSA